MAYQILSLEEFQKFLKASPGRGADGQTVLDWLADVDKVGHQAATIKHRRALAEYTGVLSRHMRERLQSRIFDVDNYWLADGLWEAMEHEQNRTEPFDYYRTPAHPHYFAVQWKVIKGFLQNLPWMFFGCKTIRHFTQYDTPAYVGEDPYDWDDANIPEPEKRAYVTIFYGNKKKYIMEMGFLIRSIREYDQETPAVALVFPDVTEDTREKLRSHGFQIRAMNEPLSMPSKFVDRLREQAIERHQGNMRKMLVWTVTEYDKVILLDSDMIMLHDIKQLFACPYTFCGTHETEHMWIYEPTMPWLWDGCWGEKVGNGADINSGLMVVEPSRERYNDIMTQLDEYPGHLIFAEQSYLTWYWFRKNFREAGVLDCTWNFCQSVEPRGSEIKVFHFCSNGFFCYHCNSAYTHKGTAAKYAAGKKILEYYKDLSECAEITDKEQCSSRADCYYCGHTHLKCLAADDRDICHREMKSLDGQAPYTVIGFLTFILS